VAERTPSLAEEARHLHACLFRAPLGAVAVVRYEAALCEMDAASSSAAANLDSSVVSKVVERVVARRLDAEAVEYALRRRGLGGDLARRLQILCYLVEVQPASLGEFINLKSSRGRAWAALVGATLRSAWKLLKGEYLVRRHGLV
jgi:hypothetical protein